MEGEVQPRSPWLSRRYRDDAVILPRWNRATFRLEYGQHLPWEFRSLAYNVVAVLNAFEANFWQAIEVVPRWMPAQDRISGRKPFPEGAALYPDEVRDALTVLKNKTKPVLMWHLKGAGAWWEPLT